MIEESKGVISQSNPTKLTKSHFVLGQRCHKALHFHIFSPELANPSSKLELKQRDEGVEVGKYARRLYPEGVLVESVDVEAALKETQRNIAKGALTLFEATFRAGNVVIRADILTRQSVNAPWKMYEVKGTTYKCNGEARKESFRQDLAIQVWVLQQCGMILDGAYLMHLNSECVHPNLEPLFISEDYWPEIAPILSEIPSELEKLQKVLQNQAPPNVSIGRHCEQPQSCSFKNSCWNHIPSPSIFDFPNCRQRWKHFEESRIAANQLSESDFQSPMHRRVLKCYQDDEPFFDRESALEMLQQWKYPLSYFDIEAIAYPIPRHPSTRPYQNLPFQFSCHIQRDEESELEHYEFLHDGDDDPRLAFIQKMLEVLPQSGSMWFIIKHTKFLGLKNWLGTFQNMLKP